MLQFLSLLVPSDLATTIHGEEGQMKERTFKDKVATIPVRAFSPRQYGVKELAIGREVGAEYYNFSRDKACGWRHRIKLSYYG